MDSGLVYLNNRYHDPTLGTFISVDPLVAATGEPYIYASGKPTTLSDPSGLISMGNTCVAGAASRGGCDPVADNHDPRTSHRPPSEVSDDDLLGAVEHCFSSFDSCNRSFYGQSSEVNHAQLRVLYWATSYLKALMLGGSLDRSITGQFDWYGVGDDGSRVPYLGYSFGVTGSGRTRQVWMLMSNAVDGPSWADVASVAGAISTGAGVVALGCAGAALLGGVSVACAAPATAVSLVAGGVNAGADALAGNGDKCSTGVFAVSAMLPGPTEKVPAVSSAALTVTHELFSIAGSAACG